MKSFTSLLVVLGVLCSQASAHYIFWQLTYGGTKYPTYTYVRKNTNDNSPVTDLASNDLRCNQGGLTGGLTQTITVKAGESFTFTSDTPVYHNGALSIYMAKAPGTAQEYDGSGQRWFKIYEVGPTFKASGDPTWPLSQTYTYKIPPAVPNGDYLLRVEQLAVHNPPPAIPQFYISCAQITVTGGGYGTPSPLVAIPGHVKGTEQGYTANIYNNFKSYTIVGPPVWAGQSNIGTAPTTAPVPISQLTSSSKAPVIPITSSIVPVPTSTTPPPLPITTSTPLITTATLNFPSALPTPSISLVYTTIWVTSLVPTTRTSLWNVTLTTTVVSSAISTTTVLSNSITTLTQLLTTWTLYGPAPPPITITESLAQITYTQTQPPITIISTAPPATITVAGLALPPVTITQPGSTLPPVTITQAGPTVTLLTTVPPTTITAIGSGSTITITSLSIFTVTTFDTITETVTVGSAPTDSPGQPYVPPVTPPSDGGSIPKFNQCGGKDWQGSGSCMAGTTCMFSNDYYSQCV